MNTEKVKVKQRNKIEAKMGRSAYLMVVPKNNKNRMSSQDPCGIKPEEIKDI